MEQNVNKKFSVTDALYQSVMEVMKKDKKQGSIPRNEKEKDLAAHHGDPNRITHGDVLKARGVTREEVEIVYEANIEPTSAKSRSHIGNLSNPVTNSVVHPSSGKEIGIITKQPNGDYNAQHSAAKLSHQQSDTFDTKDKAHQFIRNAHAKAIKNGTLSDRFQKSKPLPQFQSKEANEEVKQVNEMSSKMKMKLGLYGKKKKTNEESVEEGMMSTLKAKVLPILTGGSDKDLLKKLQKDMGVPQTGQKPGTPVKENKDTPGNSYEHQCAIHVKSESFGEGRTITTQHASPDADGNIEWYDVMFEHGIEKHVPTSALEILVSEMHGHSKKKKM